MNINLSSARPWLCCGSVETFKFIIRFAKSNGEAFNYRFWQKCDVGPGIHQQQDLGNDLSPVSKLSLT
jgi:hypothetical protein